MSVADLTVPGRKIDVACVIVVSGQDNRGALGADVGIVGHVELAVFNNDNVVGSWSAAGKVASTGHRQVPANMIFSLASCVDGDEATAMEAAIPLSR